MNSRNFTIKFLFLGLITALTTGTTLTEHGRIQVQVTQSNSDQAYEIIAPEAIIKGFLSLGMARILSRNLIGKTTSKNAEKIIKIICSAASPLLTGYALDLCKQLFGWILPEKFTEWSHTTNIGTAATLGIVEFVRQYDWAGDISEYCTRSCLYGIGKIGKFGSQKIIDLSEAKSSFNSQDVNALENTNLPENIINTTYAPK